MASDDEPLLMHDQRQRDQSGLHQGPCHADSPDADNSLAGLPGDVERGNRAADRMTAREEPALPKAEEGGVVSRFFATARSLLLFRFPTAIIYPLARFSFAPRSVRGQAHPGAGPRLR